MKNIFSWIFALVMVAGVSCIEVEPCIRIYRKDKMEEWVINGKSPLCNVSEISITSIKYGVIAKGDQLMLSLKEKNVSFYDNYVTEKYTEDLSISIDKPDIEYAHFFSFRITSDSSKWYNFEYSFVDDGSTAAYRSVMYISASDISKTNIAYYYLLLLYLTVIEVFLIITGLCSNSAQQINIFNTVIMLGTSITFGMFSFTTLKSFGIACGVILLIAIAGVIANNIFKQKFVPIGAAFFNVVYFWITVSSSLKSYLFLAIICLTVGALYWVAWSGKVVGDYVPRVVFTLNFVLSWLQVYCYLVFVYFMTPAEYHFRFWFGPKDYPYGMPGTGIYLYWPALLFVGLVFLFESNCAYNKFGGKNLKIKLDMDSKELL